MGRAERGVEGAELVVVLLFECRELGAEGPDDVAVAGPSAATVLNALGLGVWLAVGRRGDARSGRSVGEL